MEEKKIRTVGASGIDFDRAGHIAVSSPVVEKKRSEDSGDIRRAYVLPNGSRCFYFGNSHTLRPEDYPVGMLDAEREREQMEAREAELQTLSSVKEIFIQLIGLYTGYNGTYLSSHLNLASQALEEAARLLKDYTTNAGNQHQDIGNILKTHNVKLMHNGSLPHPKTLRKVLTLCGVGLENFDANHRDNIQGFKAFYTSAFQHMSALKEATMDSCESTIVVSDADIVTSIYNVEYALFRSSKKHNSRKYIDRIIDEVANKPSLPDLSTALEILRDSNIQPPSSFAKFYQEILNRRSQKEKSASVQTLVSHECVEKDLKQPEMESGGCKAPAR